MNREQAKALLPIIQAFADGKSIQYNGGGEEDWRDCKEPSFDPRWYYRIKPEPREWYEVEIDGVKDHLEHPYYKRFASADEASASATNYGYLFGEFRVVKVREVL